MRSKYLTVVVLLLPLLLNAKAKGGAAPSMGSSKQRPPKEYKLMSVGRLWTVVSNFGNYGDPTSELPTFDWPGGTGVYYQWEGRLWIGAMVKGTPLVSHADYGAYEWYPSEGSTFEVLEGKNAISMRDLVCTFDDWNLECNEKPLGLQVHQRVMGWSIEEFCDFIIVQMDITYYKEHAYFKEDSLDIYVGIVFDSDVGGRISPDCHLDDLVGFDGDTRGEWTEAFYPVLHKIVPYPYDYVTINPDGTVTDEPDGIWDQLLIWGDERDEKVWNGVEMVRDTLYIWRNFSYIYDGDNPRRPGDDEGEPNDEGHLQVPGYIWGAFLYTPPCPYDSVWIDENGLECRMPRPRSHTWWNWENDPGTDADKFAYMVCKHPFCEYPSGSGDYHCFMQHPFVWGADEFDYRFFLTYGPFRIRDGETITVVWAGGVGYGLNGGYGEPPIFEEGKWYPGARYGVERALKAYYMGAEHSDPVHPSSPYEDKHYTIPVPPMVPYLQYSADPARGCVVLAWSDIAETTPDLKDGEYDFAGYVIYRAAYKPTGWQPIIGYYDSTFFAMVASDTVFPGFKLPETKDTVIIKPGEVFPHSWEDTTVNIGVPYFYVVTAWDRGRTEPSLLFPLESAKINYMKDEFGAEIPVMVGTPRIDPDKVLTQEAMDKITVVPNPYIGSAYWERKYEDKIMFANLPGSCKIYIYTLDGNLVKVIENTSGRGSVFWDLTSRYQQDVNSGIYIYKVEALDPATGKILTKMGKFVILRGETY